MSDPVVTLGVLRLDGVDDSGVRWKVPGGGLTGWWGSPAPRFSSEPRPRAHGVWVGESWLGARTIGVECWIIGPDRASTLAAVNALTAACSLTDTTMAVEDSLVLSATVRRSDDVMVSWTNPTAAKVSLQMLARDPRLLGTLLSASTGLPSTTGGLAVPFTLPTSIAASVVSGQVSLTNPGTIDGPVMLRIDGPTSGPVVTHVTSGRQLVFASSLVLAAGEFVTVDMERHEVLAQGVASRNGWVTSRGWSAFEPGDNTWAFTQSGAAAGGLLTVSAVPAWM